MLRARMIAGVPADLVGSLTGLTEGHFPVYARARYADDLAEKDALKRVKAGANAANVIGSDTSRKGIDVFTRKGAPIVAVNDGIVKKLGVSKKLGRYIVLQDVYGNQYTYGNLGRISALYPIPKSDLGKLKTAAKAIQANQAKADPKPTAPASAGRQVDSAANGAASTLRSDPKRMRLTRLKKGSHVVGGTVLGRVAAPTTTKASHVHFQIRPAGKGAPMIDPKPILDGWKLLEATSIYRASGRNALYDPSGSDNLSIGQVLLLPKNLLERRVLGDPRIDIYAAGRDDIRSGQIDRRVLATLEYLAESGLNPTVSSLKSGHGEITSSGNISEHWSGNAVDISAINGVPILGHQDAGGVTDQAVHRLML